MPTGRGGGGYDMYPVLTVEAFFAFSAPAVCQMEGSVSYPSAVSSPPAVSCSHYLFSFYNSAGIQNATTLFWGILYARTHFVNIV